MGRQKGPAPSRSSRRKLAGDFERSASDEALMQQVVDKAGAEIRGQLTELGVLRRSGHEHLSGSVVVPLSSTHRAGWCRCTAASCATARRIICTFRAHTEVSSTPRR